MLEPRDNRPKALESEKQEVMGEEMEEDEADEAEEEEDHTHRDSIFR